jgi:hypothetical protein
VVSGSQNQREQLERLAQSNGKKAILQEEVRNWVLHLGDSNVVFIDRQPCQFNQPLVRVARNHRAVMSFCSRGVSWRMRQLSRDEHVGLAGEEGSCPLASFLRCAVMTVASKGTCSILPQLAVVPPARRGGGASHTTTKKPVSFVVQQPMRASSFNQGDENLQHSDLEPWLNQAPLRSSKKL